MTEHNNCDPLFHIDYEEDRVSEVNFDECKRQIAGKEGFTLLQANIRSIRAKFNKLNVMLKTLEVDFDCLIFSESHLNQNVILDAYSINGYKIYSTQNNVRKTDGLVVYVKATLDHTTEEINMTDCNCLVIKIKKQSSLIIIHAFYRSPSGKERIFLEELKSVLPMSKDKNATRVLTGDLNINKMDRKSKVVQDYQDILTENGYISLLNKPTRVEGNDPPTCLDHIMAGPKITPKFKTFILQSHVLSDHYPILLNIENEIKEKREEKYLVSTKINIKQIEETIKKETWREVYTCKDVNSCVHKLTEKINLIFEQNTEKTYKKITPKLKPWITEGIITSIKKRDLLHSLCRKQPLNTRLERTYKTYRNKINSLIELARNTYLKQEVEAASGNKKKIWGIIGDVTGYKGNKNIDIQKIDIDGKIIDTDNLSGVQTIANKFNLYYSQVGMQASNGRTRVEEEDDDANQNSSMAKSYLLLNKIKPKEIEDIISELKGGSAPGHDGLKISTLKIIKKYIAAPLSYIFNICLKEGIFPTHFKKAIISPIHKKGPKHLIINYRPISLLTSFSKIFERAIKKRLVKFLDENDILSETQYGFRKGKCTTHAILNLVEDLYITLDKKEKAAITFLDLSKAFDTVDHALLLKKLQKIGIQKNAHALFKSYLTERSQQVKLNATYEQEIEVKNKAHNIKKSSINKKFRKIIKIKKPFLGDVIYNQPYSVPQGTVLSPVLYNIYVYDLNKIKLHGRLVSFADDTALLVKGKNWKEVFKKTQEDMSKIKQWLERHNLYLNMNKTKILPISLNKVNFPTQERVKIHECNGGDENCSGTCSSIDIVRSWKYLGLEIDCHLRWNNHIFSLMKRVRRYIHPFLALRKFMPNKLLQTVYFALVQSALEYGICAYGRANQTNLQKLQRVQNILLKILHKKNPRYSTVELYTNTKVLNIKKLFQKNICTHIHENKENFIKPRKHTYSIRKTNLVTRKCTTTTGQLSLKFIGVKLYENIPKEIQHERDVKKFKMLLKSWLKEHDLVVP